MTLTAGAATDTGLLRDRNEDRYWIDPERGVYLVVDGVGGQAAGEVAAQSAVDTIRECFTNGAGPGGPETRIRRAITLANNRIEDRYWIDPERGVYLVVDGVGGQ